MLREYISSVTTSWKLKALQNEAHISAFEGQKQRRYEAAAYGRRTAGMENTAKSASADHLPALRVMRARSRDFVRNNKYAKRAIEVIATNVVGSGITPSFTGYSTPAMHKKIKDAWIKWAGKKTCDFNDLSTFYGLQMQIMRAVAESGDALIMKRIDRNAEIPYELQVLESDFLDEGKNEVLPDGSFIVQGVQFNARGKRVGYWIFREHPGDNIHRYGMESRFVSKEDCLHVFEVLRPGQVRGVPMGVSAFLTLKDFDDYQDAELFKQKVAALYVMVVSEKSEPGQIVAKAKAANEYQPIDKMEPGMVEYLPAGMEANFSQPPATTNPEFSAVTLRGIAVGYGITYESLTNDYSKVNFTSGRMGNIEAGKNYVNWQDNIMIALCCDPVCEWFLQGYSLNVKGFKSNSVYATWTTPKREMLDPVKEYSALIKAIRAGIISRQEAIRLYGGDPDDVIKEWKEDMKATDLIGAKFESDPRYDAQREKPAPGQPEKK